MSYRNYPSRRPSRTETPDERRRRWVREAEAERRADDEREAREAAELEIKQAQREAAWQADWNAMTDDERAAAELAAIAANNIATREPEWARKQRLKREEMNRQSMAFAQAPRHGEEPCK